MAFALSISTVFAVVYIRRDVAIEEACENVRIIRLGDYMSKSSCDTTLRLEANFAMDEQRRQERRNTGYVGDGASESASRQLTFRLKAKICNGCPGFYTCW